MRLAKKAANGILWSSGSLIFANGFGFSVKLILAYLLVPEDFGILGMATVITGLIQIISETGISQGLIQKDKNELTNSHFHTAFVSSLVLGIILFVLVSVVVTPLAISFFNEDKLKWVIPFLSIQFLIRPYRIVPFSILTKNLEFKKLSRIEIVSTSISGIIALILAYLGLGYWALISMNVTSAIVAAPLYDKALKWKNIFQFSMQSFKELFNFSAYVTLNNSLVYLTKNMDLLIIGKVLGSVQLGIYSFAFLLTDVLRVRFMTVMNKVMYPVYGSIKNNINRVSEYYLTVIKLNCLIIFPVMMLVFLFSNELIIYIFGEKWIKAIYPLQILSIAIIIHTIGGTSASVLRALGKPNIEFKISLIDAFVVTLPLLIIATYWYGINGACWVVVISKIFNRVAFQYYIYKYINVSNKTILSAVKEPIIALLLSVLTGLIFKNMLHIEGSVFLFINIFLCLIVYVLAIIYLMREELKKYYVLIKSKKNDSK